MHIHRLGYVLIGCSGLNLNVGCINGHYTFRIVTQDLNTVTVVFVIRITIMSLPGVEYQTAKVSYTLLSTRINVLLVFLKLIEPRLKQSCFQ